MSELDFVKKMIELMDTEDEISMDSRLEDIDEWDSLSHIAFLSMCTAASDRKIFSSDIKKAETIRDLYVLYMGL